MAELELRKITYTYPGQSGPALDHISLTLKPGSFTVVTGPALSGKTSLCLLAAGLIPRVYRGHLSGEAVLSGTPMAAISPDRLGTLTGLTLQNPHAQLSGIAFTVEEEVALPLENAGVAPENIGPRVKKVMELLGISDLCYQDPAFLSGGQVQRLVLAGVLAADPELLILDEPVSQLDPSGKEDVYTLARDLANLGKTVLMADKDLERAARFAHRLVILERGRIVLDGSAKQMAADDRILALGLMPPRYTTAAMIARQKGLWPANGPLPATLDQALKGFSHDHHC